MKNWKQYERRMCRKICKIFQEPYVPFKRNQQHKEAGSCRTPRGHPGGDLLKSKRLKKLFPYTVEFKTKKDFSDELFSEWILQSISETPEDEDFVLVIHKHNSREDAAVLDKRIFWKLKASLKLPIDPSCYQYQEEKFSTKAFWTVFEEAKKKSEGDFMIEFDSDQLFSRMPEMSFSIIDFTLFLCLAYDSAPPFIVLSGGG